MTMWYFHQMACLFPLILRLRTEMNNTQMQKHMNDAQCPIFNLPFNRSIHCALRNKDKESFRLFVVDSLSIWKSSCLTRDIDSNIIFHFNYNHFFFDFHRELNELRKPTSDNVEILRFFKYMRAARDGQNGQNCNSAYKKCASSTDTEQPAMLTTFNDINKLVQARNL